MLKEIWAFSSAHSPDVLLGQHPANVTEHTGNRMLRRIFTSKRK
jgi:hypothetical protein